MTPILPFDIVQLIAKMEENEGDISFVKEGQWNAFQDCFEIYCKTYIYQRH